MSNEWNNLNDKEIIEACQYLNVNIDNNKFISDLSNIENTGKIGKGNKKYTTYELNHNGNIYHIKISIDNENKKRLEKINNIPFNMPKYERVLKQWAFIPEKDIKNKMGKITFHEREFNEVRNIVKYLAYIFYVKTGIYNIKSYISVKISDLINSAITSEGNEKYFTKKGKYIIMDLILIYNKKRVYCIFKENTRPNMQPYELVQICTKSEILYTHDNGNDNILDKVDESELPERNVQIVVDNTFISFKGTRVDFVTSEGHKFYKHITDDKHWKRIENTYEKFKNLDENKGLSEVDAKEKFKKYIKEIVKDTVDLNILKETRIAPKDTSIYIKNLEPSFFPSVTPCVFLEINLLGDLYYLVLSCSQIKSSQSEDSKIIYKFTAETLYTKEMYENRFKME